jgi:hypothetical protein
VSAVPWRNLSVGANAVFSRPTSRGDYFPWNRQPYFSDQQRRNDTTLVFEVSQRVTVATFGLDAGFQFGGLRDEAARAFSIRSVLLDVGGGLGLYRVWLDPEQTRGNESFGGLQLSLGGGVGLPVGRTSVVGLRVDDVILTDFDRDRLSLSDPLLREDLFRNPRPNPPAAKSTIHNLRFSVLFSYIPGGAR